MWIHSYTNKQDIIHHQMLLSHLRNENEVDFASIMPQMLCTTLKAKFLLGPGSLFSKVAPNTEQPVELWSYTNVQSECKPAYHSRVLDPQSIDTLEASYAAYVPWYTVKASFCLIIWY